jgi:linoleoyl-CoA desaturase
VHYPVISEIVKQTALECGITYNEHETFREAVASHYRMLKKLAEPPHRAAHSVAAAA